MIRAKMCTSCAPPQSLERMMMTMMLHRKTTGLESFLRDAEAESSGRFVNPGALRKVLLQFHLPKSRISSPFHASFNKMDGKKSAMFAWLILFNCLRGGGGDELRARWMMGRVNRANQIQQVGFSIRNS